MFTKISPRSFFVEILCSILIGVLPALIILHNFGVNDLFDYGESFNDHGFKVLLVSLAICIVAKILEKHKHNVLSSQRIGSHNLRYVISELFDRVGMTILGVYRSFAGLVFTMASYVAFHTKTLSGDVFMIFISFLFGFGCLWFTTLMQTENYKKQNPYD